VTEEVSRIGAGVVVVRYSPRHRLWWAECGFEARDVPKSAGWQWHDALKRSCAVGCRPCAAGLVQRWWTSAPATARKLVAHFSPEASAGLVDAGDEVELSRASEGGIAVPLPEGLELLPFQRAGVAYAFARERALIADEMGLGKTPQAIGLRNLLPADAAVLVICPASLRLNWRNEWARFSAHPEDVVHVVDSREEPPPGANVVIVNYDRIKGEMLEALKARLWALLVCDEAHMLKTPTSKRTIAVLGDEADRDSRGVALVDCAQRVLMLTGTPMLNRPYELFGLLRVLDPGAWPSRFRFGQRFCNGKQVSAGRGKLVWDFSGASHLGELHETLRATVMVRRRKAEVLTELPPKRRQLVVLPAPDAAARRAVEGEREAWEQTTAAIDMGLAHGLSDATYAEAVDRLSADVATALRSIATERKKVAIAKVPAVAEHVGRAMEETDRLIVWTHHHEVTDALEALLREQAGWRVRVADGRTALPERQGLVADFQAPAGPPMVAVLGIHAMGVGHTMTRCAHAIFAELDWVPALVTQAEDRCHRIGQRDAVLVQHLVLDGSLDAILVRMMLRKQAIADRALDGAGAKAGT
jgi:SWI/SNF-related matrix-associated actin-dependent regulator 1 of chromatin subfamily A